jgi:hypothetical protein
VTNPVTGTGNVLSSNPPGNSLYGQNNDQNKHSGPQWNRTVDSETGGFNSFTEAIGGNNNHKWVNNPQPQQPHPHNPHAQLAQQQNHHQNPQQQQQQQQNLPIYQQQQAFTGQSANSIGMQGGGSNNMSHILGGANNSNNNNNNGNPAFFNNNTIFGGNNSSSHFNNSSGMNLNTMKPGGSSNLGGKSNSNLMGIQNSSNFNYLPNTSSLAPNHSYNSHQFSNNLSFSNNNFSSNFVGNHSNSSGSLQSRNSSLFPILEERMGSHDHYHDNHHNLLNIEPIRISNHSVSIEDIKQKHLNIPSPGLESQLARHGNSHYSDDELEKFFDCYENMIASDSVSENLQSSLRNFKGSSFSSGRSLFQSGGSGNSIMKNHDYSVKSIDDREDEKNVNFSQVSVPDHHNINPINSNINHINSNNSNINQTTSNTTLPAQQSNNCVNSNSMDCENSSESETRSPQMNTNSSIPQGNPSENTKNIGISNNTLNGSGSSPPQMQSKQKKANRASVSKKKGNENLPFLNIIKEEIHTSDSSRSFRQESISDIGPDNMECLIRENLNYGSVEDLGKIIKNSAENPEISGALDLLFDNSKTPSLFSNSRSTLRTLDGLMSDSRGNLSLRTFSKPSFDNDRLLLESPSSNFLIGSPFINLPLSVNSLQHLSTPSEEYRRFPQVNTNLFSHMNDGNRFESYLSKGIPRTINEKSPSSDNIT